MADTRFFEKKEAITLGKLAALCECELGPGANPDMVIEDVKSIEEAGSSDLTWAFIASVRDALQKTKAGACITSEKFASCVPETTAVLLSKDPHRSYGLAAQYFYPVTIKEGISPRAFVDETAKIGKGCRIDAGAVVGANAEIGDGSWIQAGAVVGEGVKLGMSCIIGSNATVTHCLAGHKVYIYPGAMVGQDGFGFAMSEKGPTKVPQLGRVVIGDDVEIGSNTTVDRGAMGDTEIGSGTRIDNLVQIAHNVKLGRCCIVVAQVGIAGSTELGDFVVAGGQVGIAGHLKVGSGARLGAQSGIMKDVEAGAVMMGSPALPHMDFMRQNVILQKVVSETKKGTLKW